MNGVKIIMRFYAFAFTALMLLNQSSAEGKELIKARVERVIDGDTVVLKEDKTSRTITCRLYGIDVPETQKPGRAGQPYSKEAMDELEKLINGKHIEITITGDKTYGREVCVLRTDGHDINLQMIKLGFAWAYRVYLKPPFDEAYISAETEARESRAGLWIQNSPEPPWEFRRHKPSDKKSTNDTFKSIYKKLLEPVF